MSTDRQAFREPGGFDTACSLALEGGINNLWWGYVWLCRVATKEWPVSKPFWWLSGGPGRGGFGFDSVCSLALTGRLNQLWRGCARRSAQPTLGRVRSQAGSTGFGWGASRLHSWTF